MLHTIHTHTQAVVCTLGKVTKLHIHSADEHNSNVSEYKLEYRLLLSQAPATKPDQIPKTAKSPINLLVYFPIHQLPFLQHELLLRDKK